MVLLLWVIFVIYVWCLSCFLACLLQPFYHLLANISWLSCACMWCYIVFMSLFHLVARIRCGAWFYRFLNFAFFLTFNEYNAFLQTLLIRNQNLALIYVKKGHKSVKNLQMISKFKLDLYLMMLYPSVNFEWNWCITASYCLETKSVTPTQTTSRSWSLCVDYASQTTQTSNSLIFW